MFSMEAEEMLKLKSLNLEDLPAFCDNLRSFIIETVAKIGGHLGASLGVVELTVALHYVFSSPSDKIIWDVGHQCYPHKVLTGRKDKLENIRKLGGISGFTSIFESEHDIFGAGHSSTSISAALGILSSLTLYGKNSFVIPVIGDGAMSAGLAFEALNNITEIKGNMIVVLNDNDMSISPPTGAISKYLPRLANSESFNEIRNISKYILPKKIKYILKKAEKTVKNIVIGENIFEGFGMNYKGPFDGHDVISLVKLFQGIKLNEEVKFPLLLHIKTQKGKGYEPAEKAADKFHGVSSFCVETGVQNKSSLGESFSKVASCALLKAAKQDKAIVAITPAMKAGSVLEEFASSLPDRFFDVGIAEQHAVCFSAGQGISGLKPYCFIYSTFLQRAYDQVIHDVCLQNIPVRFIIDRAGIVGEDGATHNGVFDVAFLRVLPNIAICHPSSKEELEMAIEFSVNYNKGPLAIRFNKGLAPSFNYDSKFEFGRGNVIQTGSDIAILCIGKTLEYALEIKENFTIIDLRFIKPIDEELVVWAFKNHKKVVLIEDASIGGLYSIILELLHKNNISSAAFKEFILPDKFIEHGKVEEIHEELGLKGDKLKQEILRLLNNIKV